MRISREGRVSREYILWIVNHLVSKLGQPIYFVLDNIFRKYSASAGRLGYISRPFIMYQSTAFNQKPVKGTLMQIWKFADIFAFT